LINLHLVSTMRWNSTTAKSIEPPENGAREEFDGGETSANAQANRIAMNALSQQFNRDPSMDMTALLKQIAETYGNTRRTIRESADRSLAMDVHNDYRKSRSQDVRIKLQTSSTVQIVKPLHDRAQTLLRMKTDTSSVSEDIKVLGPDSVVQLNHLLAQSSVIWELGRLAVLQLSPQIVVKAGVGLDVEHVDTLDYIKQHAPAVPIPDVLGILSAEDTIYLFQTWIEGDPLDKLWPSLTKTQKTSIQNQLSTVFADLRSIPRYLDNDGKLTLGGGNPRRCKDMRRELRTAHGPISNEEEFDNFILSCGDVEVQLSGREMIHSFLGTDHEIVMTHGDLHPRNIMVTETLRASINDSGLLHGSEIRVTGLLDWEMVGWYPSYWEYVKALHTTSSRDGTADWWAYLPIDVIGSWGPDYAVDLMISRQLS